MSDFFLGQVITASLDTDASLAGATVAQIHYRKPNGDTGAWNGVINGDIVSYTTTTGDIDLLGNWRVQAYSIIGGVVKKGKIRIIQFKRPIL